MRRKASFHFIHIIRTKNFNESIYITVDAMFILRVLMINESKLIHNMDISNHTLYFVKISLDLIRCFWPIFVDFQNEAAGLCFDNSIDKDVKRTFMLS